MNYLFTGLLILILTSSCTTDGGVERRFPKTMRYSFDSTKVQVNTTDWKNVLPDDVYGIAWRKETEAPFSSPLNEEKRTGTYYCYCCDWKLFSSRTKFDSKTGWPSFYEPIQPTAIASELDNKMVIERMEVVCSRCGAHLGHVFDDGPLPTGKRYCINGKVLVFRPSNEKNN